MNIDCTRVFSKNWKAIHETNPDGSRKYRYIINTGSSRSSKTFSLIDCYDLYARANREKRMTVWRDTKKDCKDTVMNDYIKRLRSTDRYSQRHFNKTESINHYTNGSRVEFRGTDEEGVFGLTQDCAWFNEPYSISRDIFDQIDQRTSDFIFIDWNPKENHYIDELSKHPRALVIHSTFRDNPFCPDEQRIKILSYEPTEENIRNFTANKYKWDVYGLGIKGEVEGKIFTNYEVIKEIPKSALFYGYGMDFGFSNDPTTLIAMYLHGKGVLYDEIIYSTGLKTTPLAMLMKEKGVKPNQLIVADRSSPMMIDELFEKGFNNIHPASSEKEIIYGIAVMQDRPIYLTERSTNLIREFDNYKNQKDKYGKFINEPEKNQEDHGIDAARYITTDKFTRSDFFIL